LRKLAAAESTLRSGQMDVTIDDSTAGRMTRQVRFDLGDQQHSPRVFWRTTYEPALRSSAEDREQTIERVTVGDRTWERKSGGAWMAQTTHQSVLAQILPLLPPLGSIANLEMTFEAGADVLRWYDAKSNVDITLAVDPQTGVPRELRQIPRGGVAVTVAYSGWNTPVKIEPPGGA